MKDRFLYHPEMNMEQIRAFDARVQNLPVSWTMTHSFVHSGDPRILQLRWIIPDEPWCNPPGFLAFLDQREHRVLLRCFLNRKFVTSLRQTFLSKQSLADAERSLLSAQDIQLHWSFEKLAQRLGPHTERNMVERALHFLELQEMIEQTDQNSWSQGSQLDTVPNFGATFEWMVQEYLQRFHAALARRCVSFQEWQTAHLNDIDVLAFLDDLVLLVECKSSTDFSIEHLARFVQRAMAFPTGLALLLIDTASEEHIKRRQQQINTLLGRDTTNLHLLYHHDGSLIIFLTEKLCIANTAGGIAASLEGMLLARRRESHSFSSNLAETREELPEDNGTSHLG